MIPPDDKSLRMVPPESPEQLARRVEREKLSAERVREQELEQSLKPFRVGSVPYLNAVPLTRGLEDEIKLYPPVKLAEMLRRDELDAAWRWIDPIREAWQHQDDKPKSYTAGTGGPAASSALSERDGFSWNDEL